MPKEPISDPSDITAGNVEKLASNSPFEILPHEICELIITFTLNAPSPVPKGLIRAKRSLLSSSERDKAYRAIRSRPSEASRLLQVNRQFRDVTMTLVRRCQRSGADFSLNILFFNGKELFPTWTSVLCATRNVENLWVTIMPEGTHWEPEWFY